MALEGGEGDAAVALFGLSGALACNLIRFLLGSGGLENHQPPRRTG
jgi:hypothetical protein